MPAPATTLQVLQQKLAAAHASPSPFKAGDLTAGIEERLAQQTGQPVPAHVPVAPHPLKAGDTCRLTSRRFPKSEIVWVVKPIEGTTCYLVELCADHQFRRPRRAYATRQELKSLKPAWR